MPEIQRARIWDEQVVDDLIVDLAVAARHLIFVGRIVCLQGKSIGESMLPFESSLACYSLDKEL